MDPTFADTELAAVGKLDLVGGQTQAVHDLVVHVADPETFVVGILDPVEDQTLVLHVHGLVVEHTTDAHELVAGPIVAVGQNVLVLNQAVLLPAGVN